MGALHGWRSGYQGATEAASARHHSLLRAGASAQLLHERAYELEMRGELCDAAGVYRRALQIEPGNPDLHFNLANVLRGMNRHRDARGHLLCALRHDPYNAEGWYNLADLHDHFSDSAMAIESLQRAVELNPMYADAHYNLARCLQEAHRFTDAAHHWRMYLRLDRGSEWAAEAHRCLMLCCG